MIMKAKLIKRLVAKKIQRNSKMQCFPKAQCFPKISCKGQAACKHNH